MRTTGVGGEMVRLLMRGLAVSAVVSSVSASPAIYRILDHNLPPTLDPGKPFIAKVRFQVVTCQTPPFDRPAMLVKSKAEPGRQFRVQSGKITPWIVGDLLPDSIHEVTFKLEPPSDFPPGAAVIVMQMFRKSDGPPERWDPASFETDSEPLKTGNQFVRQVQITGVTSAWPINRYVVGVSPHCVVSKALRDIPQKIDVEAEVEELRKHGIDYILGGEEIPSDKRCGIPPVCNTYANQQARNAEAIGPAGAYFADPLVIDAMTAKGIMLAALHRGTSAIFAISGLDEPWGAKNEILAKPEDRRQGLRAAVYREVKQQFGAGKIEAPASEKDTDPLAWMAFHRWYDRQFQVLQSRLYRGVKQVDPKRAVMGHNFFFLRCVPCWDYAEMGKYFDACTLDPYHQRIALEAGPRALYHVAFSTKLVADLTGKPTLPIPGFMQYWRDTPSPEECLELANQALRGGAAGLMYYLVDWGPYRYLRYPAEEPGRWDALMSISSVLHEMKPITFPATRTLVLFPTDSYAAVNEARADEIYVAHAAIGENAHVWYRFISDRQIGRGEGGLSNAAVLYVPYAPYIEPEVVQQVVGFVKSGGTLVLGDDQAFAQTPLGEAIDPQLRGALLKAGENQPVELWSAADGLPAFRVVTQGKGRVVMPEAPVFTLNNTQSLALAGLIKKIQTLAGGDGPSEVWNFTLPRERILGQRGR